MSHQPPSGDLLSGAAVAFLALGSLLPRRRPGGRRALRRLRRLDPAGFEQAVAEICRHRLRLRRVRVIGGAGDEGVDVICRGRRNSVVVVQCKRYAPERRVGSTAVQSFLGMATVRHHADLAVMVTTSSFTEPCRRIERGAEGRLWLVDGQELARLLR